MSDELVPKGQGILENVNDVWEADLRKEAQDQGSASLKTIVGLRDDEEVKASVRLSSAVKLIELGKDDPSGLARLKGLAVGGDLSFTINIVKVTGAGQDEVGKVIDIAEAVDAVVKESE